MAKYTQANRALSLTTPLGPDALLLEKLTGSEGVSQPFHFRLELLAEQAVAFDRLIGQAVAVELRPPHLAAPRYFHGVVGRLWQAGRVRAPDEQTMFIRYRLELVPKFWTLRKQVRSRVFHDLSVPEILQQVLKSEGKLDVSQAISYPAHFPRHSYRVQYQESDFAFASRLMEEAGLIYYFKHSATGHEMVIADDSPHCPELNDPAKIHHDEFEGGRRDQPRITAWEKVQELCPGEFTLADYHFELPSNDLTAQTEIQDQVAVGTVAHSLKASSEGLAVHHYPGRYTSHFDSVDASGMVSVSSRLDPLYQEKDWRARVAMEQAAAEALQIEGASDAGHFTAGCKFELADHFDANGKYLLTQVEHDGSLEGAYTTGGEARFVYRNRFRCLPAELPYRAPSSTPRPSVAGTQTAVVIGTPGIDPPVDRYGRVKVQFHWNARKDAGQSCWVRVGQSWAGNRWGAFFWPRIGHEVIVAFENGDPDRPIIVGSVYNADNMPPLELPLHSSAGGIKSCSIGGNPLEHFCSFVFHDNPGDEHLHLHSEKHVAQTTEASRFNRLPGRHLEVVGSFAVPESGSGAGAGLLEWGAMPGCSGLAHWEHENLPGKYVMIAGDNTGITLGGRITHILGGSEVKVSCDLEAIVIGGLASLAHSPLVAGLEAVGLGVGGDVSLTYGPKVSSVYNGPIPGHINVGQKIDIIRGEELKFSNKGFDGIVGKAAFALNALTLASAFAGAIWTYCSARPSESPASSGSGSNGTHGGGSTGHQTNVSSSPPPSSSSGGDHTNPLSNISSSPAWAKALSTSICTRLHALLNMVEVMYGRAQQAKKMAAAAVKAAESAEKLLTALPMKGYVVPQADLAKEYTEAAAQATAAAAWGTFAAGVGGAAAMAKWKSAANQAQQKALEKYAGSFTDHNKNCTIAATNMSFLVIDPTPPAVPAPPSGIDLAALGTADQYNGHICARASGGVLVTAGGEASLGLKTGAAESQINLQSSKLGTIELQQGTSPTSPFIKISETDPADPAIYLQAGTDETGSARATLESPTGSPNAFFLAGTAQSAARLMLDGTTGDQSALLNVGPSATATKVELTTTGITLQFQKQTIKLDATGITLSTGPGSTSLTLTPTDITINGMNMTTTLKGTRQDKAALTQVQ